MEKILTKNEVRKAQEMWGEGIIEIGKAYKNKEDYRKLAEDFVDNFYGFDEGIVLFKPTLASIEQFRDTREKAISYFIAGNPDHPEDQGFALRPWSEIHFQNEGIILIQEHAITMGNYFFTDYDGAQSKVEYTIGYYRSEDGTLKINIHHSSIPYKSS